jgi:hypothetical protein
LIATWVRSRAFGLDLLFLLQMKGFERIDDALDLNVLFALERCAPRFEHPSDLTGAEEINHWRLAVVSPGRTIFGTRAHCAVSSVTLRRLAWHRLLVSFSASHCRRFR